MEVGTLWNKRLFIVLWCYCAVFTRICSH